MSGQSPGRDPLYLYHLFPLKVEGVPVAYGVLVSPMGELVRRQRIITLEILLAAVVICGLCIPGENAHQYVVQL